MWTVQTPGKLPRRGGRPQRHAADVAGPAERQARGRSCRPERAFLSPVAESLVIHGAATLPEPAQSETVSVLRPEPLLIAAPALTAASVMLTPAATFPGSTIDAEPATSWRRSVLTNPDPLNVTPAPVTFRPLPEMLLIGELPVIAPTLVNPLSVPPATR